jgi:nitroimidazol reductase NimA-like FMN-containing flavoprotein (pyridoxamine 5'-phosphate oxidase superfamily)
MSIRVTTRALDRDEMNALLTRHHVGSMALAFHDRVTIALVNYVYADRWIYGRMEDGPDLATIRHHHWSAFEVNEIGGIYDWRTVTVHGSIQLLSDEPSSPDAKDFDTALRLLRSAVPVIFTPRDPMPERVQLLRLYADDLVGREARSNSAPGLPAA